CAGCCHKKAQKAQDILVPAEIVTIGCVSATEARGHPFVDLARHTHVVEIVFANQIQFSGLVKIEHFASFNLGGLARIDSERPRDVVETDVTSRAQPPTMHRVEHAAHVVIAEIHERSHLDRVHQTTLKNERKIEADDVVPDELVAVGVEVFHEA